MFIIIIVGIVLFCAAPSHGQSYKVESDLHKALFKDSNYDTGVIPIVDSTKPLKVQLFLGMNYLLDIDEKQGMMTAALYPSLSWTDERLKWEPHDYDNLMSISVLPEKLWMPDVQVFNSVGAASADTLHSPKVTVFSNGTLYHTFGLVSRTPCELNLISFPFDVNTCFIQFGSWSEPNRRIELELQDTTQSLAFYGRHPSWKLQNFTAQANDIIISDTETFTELSISVRVARKGSYYYRLFVAPAAVCMFVIPVIHFLPPSSNEKLTLGGLMLVVVAIMFEMAEDFFPAFSLGNVPLVLHYYTGLLIILFMSLLLSCLSVVIGTGESKSVRVPRILRICCIDRLGYICCAKGRTSRYDYELLHLERSLRSTAKRQSSREEDETELTEMTDVDSQEERDAAAQNHTTPNGTGENSDGMKEVLKTLINELQYARYKEQIKSEWLQLAIVIDRTGGLILLLLAIIVTSVITLHPKSW